MGLVAQLTAIDTELTTARTASDDIQREVAKADQDVALVRERSARDQARLLSGQGSPKDLQALQHEIESLARRQNALEDIELEVMERAETLQAQVDALASTRAALADEVARAASARDEALGTLAAEADGLRGSRGAVVDEVGPDLVTLYEKIRSGSTSGGVAAAELRQRRCSGCHLELGTVDMSHIAAAPADEVLRCEECRRILVRTPLSGL